jgi:hypothetical protein
MKRLAMTGLFALLFCMFCAPSNAAQDVLEGDWKVSASSLARCSKPAAVSHAHCFSISRNICLHDYVLSLPKSNLQSSQEPPERWFLRFLRIHSSDLSGWSEKDD